MADSASVVADSGLLVADSGLLVADSNEGLVAETGFFRYSIRDGPNKLVPFLHLPGERERGFQEPSVEAMMLRHHCMLGKSHILRV